MSLTPLIVSRFRDELGKLSLKTSWKLQVGNETDNALDVFTQCYAVRALLLKLCMLSRMKFDDFFFSFFCGRLTLIIDFFSVSCVIPCCFCYIYILDPMINRFIKLTAALILHYWSKWFQYWSVFIDVENWSDQCGNKGEKTALVIWNDFYKTVSFSSWNGLWQRIYISK